MKGALLVGINNYPGSAKLDGCVNDATELSNILECNGDGSKNFHINLQHNVSSRASLRAMVSKLFQSDLHTALFYFSGHGCVTERGGFIVTPDFTNYDEGISMDELLNIVNRSSIKDKIIIIDCCHAGAFGNPVAGGGNTCLIAEGVTIMTATRQTEQAIEVNGHGIFTYLLLEALKGGAADITGTITPGSVYAYIDRSMGFWQQRPQFKINITRFTTLKTVLPLIPIEEVLKRITVYFPSSEDAFALNPSFEPTNEDVVIAENAVVFSHLQRMNRAGLVVPIDAEHMYYAAQKSKGCRLTALGKHYWTLVKQKRI